MDASRVMDGYLNLADLGVTETRQSKMDQSTHEIRRIAEQTEILPSRLSVWVASVLSYLSGKRI